MKQILFIVEYTLIYFVGVKMNRKKAFFFSWFGKLKTTVLHIIYSVMVASAILEFI